MPMSVITTSTAPTATAYSNQRKIDRTSNGVLWAFWTEAGYIYNRYSTDDGATWNVGSEIFFSASGSYVQNCSVFIDIDDYAHVVLKAQSNGYIYYMRGTPNAARTAWTWSAATVVHSSSSTADYPDIIAHREGLGWVVHITYAYMASTNNFTYYRQINISSTGTISNGNGSSRMGASIGGGYSAGSNSWTYPSIDFNHTGDGKTVAGGTPHLYVAWSAGATGAGKGIRFKKATYSGGSWTWGTEREIDSTAAVTNINEWIVAAFDGTRAVITSNHGYKAKVWERDAADTTTTAWAGAEFDYLIAGSAAYDGDGNAYIFGRDNRASSGTQGLVYRKWVRATGAFDPVVTIETSASNAPYVSAKRGYSGNKIEFIYTDGTTSPYSVTYDSISLGPPTIAVDLLAATETSTAQPLGRVKRKALGVAVDTSAAQPLARRKTKGLGVVTETTTAQPLAKRKTKALGVVTETNTAQPLAKRKTKALGVVTETTTALSIVTRPKIILSLGIATEAVTALPLTASQRYPDFFFTPPVGKVRAPMSMQKPFRFYGVTVSSSVVFRNGHFQEVRSPEADEVDDLVEGVTWFPGGRTHQVDNDTKLLLEADGFTVDSV